MIDAGLHAATDHGGSEPGDSTVAATRAHWADSSVTRMAVAAMSKASAKVSSSRDAVEAEVRHGRSSKTSREPKAFAVTAKPRGPPEAFVEIGSAARLAAASQAGDSVIVRPRGQ